jgi:hypothetical protein
MCSPTISLLDLTGRLRRLDEIIVKNDLKPVSDSIKEMVHFSNQSSVTPRLQRDSNQSSSSRHHPKRKFEYSSVNAKPVLNPKPLSFGRRRLDLQLETLIFLHPQFNRRTTHRLQVVVDAGGEITMQ